MPRDLHLTFHEKSHGLRNFMLRLERANLVRVRKRQPNVVRARS
jgi:hypothetical protein